MSRVNNKGKGSGGFRHQTPRKKKQIKAMKTLNRKMDILRKTGSI